MIANFFKKSSPATIVFLLVIFFLIYGLSVFTNVISFSWLSVLLVLFFVGTALLINRRNKLTFGNLYFFLFLIILIGLFPELLIFNKILVVNILLLFVYRKIYSLQFLPKIDSKVFDASFWIGVVFIFEPLCLFFLLILFVAIVMHGRLRVRLFMLSLIGVFVAPFLFFTYSFLLGQEDIFYSLFLFDTNLASFSVSSPSTLYNLIFVGVFALFSIIVKSLQALVKNNTFKISWILVLLHFSFSLVLFFTSHDEGHGLLYILFPTAIVLSNGIELYENKPISDVVLGLLIINMFVPCLV